MGKTMEIVMTKEDIKEALRENRDILRRYNVHRIGVFGSHARGRAKKKSDVDLLVEFKKTIDLFDFIHLADEIGTILDARVDLATKDSLKPPLKPRVMEEELLPNSFFLP